MNIKKMSRRLLHFSFRATMLAGIAGCTALLAVFGYTYIAGPPETTVQESPVIYSADGTIIGESASGERRHWVTRDEIAPELEGALLAVEDRKFFDHNGLDYQRIGGAVYANLQDGRLAQGASTITQQYARNLFLTFDKTWQRKFQEMLYTLRLEWHMSKDEIFTGYMNTIYFGHGAYGVEAASRLYFNKSAADLTLAESAVLAAIPRGPTYYSPFADEERSLSRQQVVLQAMEQEDMVTAEEAEQASAEVLNFASLENQKADRTAPHFQDEVLHMLEHEHGLTKEEIQQQGLEIHTTLDADKQEAAERWVTEEMPHDSDLQSAFVAIAPDSGDVEAMVGAVDYEESPFNRAVRAERPPGSTFKPFLYYAALEQGFTPVTPFVSEPTTFVYADGEEEYEPGNFADNYAHDFITLAEAMAFSDNIFAVKTHMYLGFEALIETARAAGITSEIPPSPSLALGTENVGVTELTAGYAPFANGGSQVEPRFIEKVIDREGNVLIETEPNTQETLDERYAYMTTDMMSGMFDLSLNRHTSVTGSTIAPFVQQPAAGKSGSTSADSWMIGFTPDLLTGVWVGYDEGRTLDHSSEGQIAKNIWAKFLREQRENTAHAFEKPDDIVEVDIHTETGLLHDDACGSGRTMAFVEGTEPEAVCTEEMDIDPERNRKEDELPERKNRFFDRLKNWLGL
ncbi:1A family penicillin-binding protein [Salsuginibacillus halophilus]|uniref:1A family penicillin-binding protein n=1 Tax=Salsuginibacillus halophilus TaxID=517424 RepID=A0A2P8HI26_9BACI|nr:PBP1A family penicillin-binding protein [Salsuginibacillus halophilus]PSL45861.1 1A family penicillin-binding protein [Salsuginibacillus halophilus]